MALVLNPCIVEECDGISYHDKTRDFSVSNPTGYGPENGVDGPADFDTYVFRYWAADIDPSTAPPTFTFDLLSDVPEQAADGDYDWPTFTFEQMGVSSIAQGIAYFEVVATKDGDTYRSDFTALLVKDLVAQVAEKLKTWKPGCKCADGCIPPQRLAEAMDIVRCGWDCDEDQTKDILKWIKANINNCC